MGRLPEIDEDGFDEDGNFIDIDDVLECDTDSNVDTVDVDDNVPSNQISAFSPAGIHDNVPDRLIIKNKNWVNNDLFTEVAKHYFPDPEKRWQFIHRRLKPKTESRALAMLLFPLIEIVEEQRLAIVQHEESKDDLYRLIKELSGKVEELSKMSSVNQLTSNPNTKRKGRPPKVANK